MAIEVEDLYHSNQPIILLGISLILQSIIIFEFIWIKIIAAYIGVHEIFRILIQKKNVNVNLQNECGHTALMAGWYLIKILKSILN